MDNPVDNVENHSVLHMWSKVIWGDYVTQKTTCCGRREKVSKCHISVKMTKTEKSSLQISAVWYGNLIGGLL